MNTKLCPNCGYPLERLAIEQQFTGYTYFPVNRIDDGALVIDWEAADEAPDVSFVPNTRRVIHLDCFSFVEGASLDANGVLTLAPAVIASAEVPATQEPALSGSRRTASRRRARSRRPLAVARRASKPVAAAEVTSGDGASMASTGRRDTSTPRRGKRAEDSIAA